MRSLIIIVLAAPLVPGMSIEGFLPALSLAVILGFAASLQRTRLGTAIRAVSDNKDLAESSGIDVEKVIRLVWIIGSALAGLGGVLFGMTENINWEMGFRLLLLMFAGVTLGGLGSAYGALVGSLIVGVFIQMSTRPQYSLAVSHSASTWSSICRCWAVTQTRAFQPACCRLRSSYLGAAAMFCTSAARSRLPKSGSGRAVLAPRASAPHCSTWPRSSTRVCSRQTT